MDVTLGSGWPFGGPHTPITEAAGQLRCDRVAVPASADIRADARASANGEKFIAAFLAQGDGSIRADGIHRSRRRPTRCACPPDSTARTWCWSSSPAARGQTVKRAAVGAEGFVLDHYDRAAIERSSADGRRPSDEALGPNPPYAVFSDSLEVYDSDWTADLLAEFQKRRGYDLTPYLPALAGDIGDKTGGIRHDWGQTLTELCEERYLTPITRMGARGTARASARRPTASRRWRSRATRWWTCPRAKARTGASFSATRWASSASHLYGRPVTSSETWTWLHSPVFRATPLDMKAEADLHFLAGHQPVDRARLALFAARGRRAGLALLCRGGVQ